MRRGAARLSASGRSRIPAAIDASCRIRIRKTEYASNRDSNSVLSVPLWLKTSFTTEAQRTQRNLRDLTGLAWCGRATLERDALGHDPADHIRVRQRAY